jgi:hypothetical protein
MPLNIVELNYQELTPAQYGKKHGMGKAAVQARCEQGHLNAYRTEGGHWKIRDYPSDVVSRKDYEELLKEHAALKAKLDGIVKLATV